MDYWRISLALLFVFIASFTSVVQADTEPIVVKGSKLFYEIKGSQFFIRGIYYHDSGSSTKSSTSFIDALADKSRCVRDIPYLARLGINTVFISSVDTRADHDVCMQLLQEAGMYVLVGMDGNSNDIPLLDTEQRLDWFDYNAIRSMTKIIDIFQKYSNTLGFIVGISDDTTAGVLSVPLRKTEVKAMKEHIVEKGYRKIPVGGSAHEYDLSTVPQYLNCGESISSADFYGLEVGFSDKARCPNFFSMLEDGLVESYRSYSIPVFFFYGCPVEQRENFGEVQGIYNKTTTEVFSGGVAYEWMEDWNFGADLGLVEVKGDSVKLRPGYTALSSQLAIVTPSSTQMSQYSPTNLAQPNCQNFTSWEAIDSTDNSTRKLQIAVAIPPSPYQRLCSCMMESSGCIADPSAKHSSLQSTRRSLCSQNSQWCLGTKWNQTTGTYGSFSSCNETEATSWVLNQFYLSQKNNVTACKMVGGIPQQSIEVSSQSEDCQILLKQSGTDGSGTITFTPTPMSREGVLNNTTAMKKGHSLSRREKVGVGVGVAIGAIAGIIAAIWLICVRAKNKRKISSTESEESQKAELGGNEVKVNEEEIHQLDSLEVKELSGNGVTEMDSKVTIFELSSDSKPVEIGSSQLKPHVEKA